MLQRCLYVDTVYLAILAAVSTGLLFGLHDVTVRISGLKDAGSGVLVSLIAGYPVILILAFALGGFELVGLKAFIFYVLAGVINFPVGRASMYRAIGSIGAGATSVLVSTSVIYNLFIGLALGEPIGLPRIAGSLLLLLAVALLVQGGGLGRLDLMGVFFGLLGGLSMAIAITLGRLGNLESGNPIAGVLIAYTSGLLVEVLLALRGNSGVEVRALGRGQLTYIALAGLLAALGQAARYVALMGVGVSIVTPLQNTRPVVATVTASLLSRRTGEGFKLSTLTSSMLTLIGSILVMA
jgi:drug/metabolite transporter (DMT)-like permease